jgi:Flp pilus assembly protein TadG
MIYRSTLIRGQLSPSVAGRRAISAIEFAVVVPVFVVIVLGMIEIDRALMVQHLLTNAARQGARIGVIEGKSTSDITTAVYNGLTSMGISGDTATVQVNDNTADASTANVNDEITVIVTVPVANVSWLPGLSFLSGNLTGRYTLRRE